VLADVDMPKRDGYEVRQSICEPVRSKGEAAARPPAPIVTDELIEEIVSRVTQRMSDRVVRDTVTDIVSQTAEDLCRTRSSG
jgi:hypothetical protein